MKITKIAWLVAGFISFLIISVDIAMALKSVHESKQIIFLLINLIPIGTAAFIAAMWIDNE